MKWRLLKTLLLSIAVVAMLTAPAAAQDDIFDEPAESPPTAEQPSAPSWIPEDPVVEALRESNPSTPADLVRAVEITTNLKQFDEAKRYLGKLIGSKPTNATLAELHEEFGTTLFMRFARERGLAPDGARLADAVLAAAGKSARNPQRLLALIDQLGDPSPAKRHSAVVRLRQAGSDAMGPMLATLADPQQAKRHGAVRFGLMQMDSAAIEPLIAAIAAPEQTVRVTAIEVLGHLESRRAVPYLLAPHLAQDSSPAVRQAAGEALQSIVGALPSQMDAEHFLLRKATAYYDGQPPLAADQEDNVVLWKWDAAAQRSVPLTLPASDGAAWVAAQLAADLYRLAPGPVEHQRLYLATALEWAKIEGGLDRPLPTGANTVHAAVAQAGVAAVEQVLVDAAPNDHVAAAVGALEVLGAIGDVSLLITPHGRVGPVASALRHTDRRVRFAAAAAIMNIDPHQAYPGSSYLPETLSEFTTVGATPRVLIGHPRQGHGLRVANLLAEMGYVGDAVTSGRELLRLATNRSDYDFVLISDAIDGPAATDVIRQLRRLPAFASVPVGLMGSEATLAGAKRWAVQDPLVDALPLPWESESLALRLRRLEALAGRHVVAHADRLRQARQALMWLAKLADDANAYGHYDLLRRQDTMIAALYEPALAADAAVALGKVGSPKAQTALVEVASLHWHPIAVRQAAHSAFGEAVERRRLLLTTDQILLQYDRYQQSAQLDRETQAVFGAILDTIEAASKTHSGPPQPEEDDAS